MRTEALLDRGPPSGSMGFTKSEISPEFPATSLPWHVIVVSLPESRSSDFSIS
jgi:hypothetical protein